MLCCCLLLPICCFSLLRTCSPVFLFSCFIAASWMFLVLVVVYIFDVLRCFPCSVLCIVLLTLLAVAYVFKSVCICIVFRSDVRCCCCCCCWCYCCCLYSPPCFGLWMTALQRQLHTLVHGTTYLLHCMGLLHRKSRRCLASSSWPLYTKGVMAHWQHRIQLPAAFSWDTAAHRLRIWRCHPGDGKSIRGQSVSPGVHVVADCVGGMVVACVVFLLCVW